MAKSFKRILVENPISKYKELKIKCYSAQCNEGLHCFSKKEARKRNLEEGKCIECGEAVIEWDKIQDTDMPDLRFVVESLEKELIRFGYWNGIIDHEAVRKARNRGKNALRESAYKAIKRTIGGDQNFREGRQTSYAGDNIINYARHATGCCCRFCFEDWYGVPIGMELTDKQIQFCTEMVMLYIDRRIPDLQDDKLLGANKLQ